MAGAVGAEHVAEVETDEVEREVEPAQFGRRSRHAGREPRRHFLCKAHGDDVEDGGHVVDRVTGAAEQDASRQLAGPRPGPQHRPDHHAVTAWVNPPVPDSTSMITAATNAMLRIPMIRKRARLERSLFVVSAIRGADYVSYTAFRVT